LYLWNNHLVRLHGLIHKSSTQKLLGILPARCFTCDALRRLVVAPPMSHLCIHSPVGNNIFNMNTKRGIECMTSRKTTYHIRFPSLIFCEPCGTIQPPLNFSCIKWVADHDIQIVMVYII
jgi:hypothetical protein